MTKQIARKNPDFDEIKPVDYHRLLVISIGTGSNRAEQKYNAKIASKWGILSWMYNHRSTPITDSYGEASANMVNYHNCVVFEAFHSENSYLRIDVSFLEFFFSCSNTCLINLPELYCEIRGVAWLARIILFSIYLLFFIRWKEIKETSSLDKILYVIEKLIF